MNDPWDVKSVRQSGQYISCMKINGVALLPPVLSKECRKEMQYYKLLAKEVEKRISMLQPYVSSTSLDSDDLTDAPELPEYEHCYELPQGDPRADLNGHQSSAPNSPICVNNLTSNTVKNMSPIPISTNFTLDLSLRINETGGIVLDKSRKNHSPPLREQPERDYNCVSRITKTETTEKEVILELDNEFKKNNNYDEDFNIDYDKDLTSDPFPGVLLQKEGPASLSSKSFTGSLNDIHSESIKDSEVESSKLIRQSSYTLLQPGPQLLAHLQTQAQSKGIAMNSISMSDSLADINTPKKRKGWDLETAKEKWSKMALELKQKNVIRSINKTNINKAIAKSVPKKINQPRARSVVPPPARRNTLNGKNLPRSEPLPKTKRLTSPDRNNGNNHTIPPQAATNKSESPVHITTLISESEDPATRVRELYEKIQNQQLAQMAALVEKQKKEQMLLQQVFEEQNNLLFKQLKIICPKSPIEPKEAWVDKLDENDRGPVSLSQLINYKSPEQSVYSSSISSTLTETNNYINHCDNILKKSRDITGSIKKDQGKSRSQNGTKIQSPRTQPEGSRTRTHSPKGNAASRKLNYDTSVSSDPNDLILTDRTNDTMADLNVTFPSDHTDESKFRSKTNSNVSNTSGKQIHPNQGYAAHTSSVSQSKYPDNNIKGVDRENQNTVRGFARTTKTVVRRHPPTPEEHAAATKIVAHVKGYLVRRLMRTERVQGIVQTIKDALLCALQLHQDREGIRGADVDLHRRLIQQITAACYNLHDTFVASTPAERCAMIAADRGRRRSLAARQPNHSFKQTDIMSQSHSGSFPARAKRSQPSLMTQSNYETFSGDKLSPVSRRYVASPHRRPWR